MARLARASAIQLSVQILQTVVGFLATIYFARVLGSATLGEYFLLVAMTTWLLMPTDGIRNATQKRVSEARDRDGYFTLGGFLFLAVLVGVAGLVVLFRTHVDRYLGYEGSWLLVAMVIGTGLFRFVRTMLRGEEKLEAAAFVEGGMDLVRVGVQVGLVVAGWGLLALVAGKLLAMVAVSAVGLWHLASRLSIPSRRHVRRLYDYAKYEWFTSIKGTSYSWMDTVVLGFFVTSAAIGVYEIAWRISAVFVLLPTAMSKTIFPDMSRHAVEGETARVEETLRRSLAFAGLFAIPGVVGALILGTEVLAIYGEEFKGGMLVLVLLSAGRLFQSYERLLLLTLNALDRPDLTFRIAILFFSLNVSLNVLFVWRFGPAGAAVATAGSILVSAAVALRYLQREINVRFAWRPIGVQAASAAVMGFLILGLRSQVSTRSPYVTVALVLLGAGVYTALVSVASTELRDRILGAIPG